MNYYGNSIFKSGLDIAYFTGYGGVLDLQLVFANVWANSAPFCMTEKHFFGTEIYAILIKQTRNLQYKEIKECSERIGEVQLGSNEAEKNCSNSTDTLRATLA